MKGRRGENSIGEGLRFFFCSSTKERRVRGDGIITWDERQLGILHDTFLHT